MIIKDLEKQYKALANRRRLAILKYLKNHSKASVGDIAAEIKLRIKATSKHLRILAACDMVEYEQQSLRVFYFIAQQKSPQFKQVLELL